MPKVFVSVALFVGLVVVAILAAGVWGEHAKGQWTQQWIQQQQIKLKAQRAASEMRDRRLRWIRSLDRQAETDPAHAEAARRQANVLRQSLGLPPEQYPETRPGSAVATGEAEPTIILKRSEEPGATNGARGPEIPRLPEPPPWLRFLPPDADPSENAKPPAETP